MISRTWTLDDLSDPAPPPGPADWNDAGVVILPDLIPLDLIHEYRAEWIANNGWQGVDSNGVTRGMNIGGYRETEYMIHPRLMELCTNRVLGSCLEVLLGEPAGVHLNLSGWVSTERDFHQDGYLNPLHVGDYYAAVWIALGDIAPESGPFQYVPGSHRWHTLTREKIGQVVDLSDPMWPKYSEDVLSPLVEAEIQVRDAQVISYLPSAGDVLIWHPRLYHRGSRATVPGHYRPALIAHYSGRFHRGDMPAAIKHPEHGGWYFPLEGGR